MNTIELNDKISRLYHYAERIAVLIEEIDSEFLSPLDMEKLTPGPALFSVIECNVHRTSVKAGIVDEMSVALVEGLAELRKATTPTDTGKGAKE